MHEQHDPVTREQDRLHIVCPPQRLAQPIVLCCAGLAVISSGVLRALRDADSSHYLFLAVALVMAAFLLAILYRNLFARDELLLVRDDGQAGGCADGIDAGSVRAARLSPVPDPLSSEGKLAWLGLGDGRIEIDTDRGSFRFGAGLHEFMLQETVDRIVSFCALDARQPPPDA
jgi:hypothetical protein